LTSRESCIKEILASAHGRVDENGMKEDSMKRALPVFIAVLLVLLAVVSSPGSTSPVVLTHALPVSSDHGKALTFSIHVESVGDAPLSNLTLSFQPRAPFVKTATKWSVGNLGAHQVADVAATLATLPRIAAGDLSLRSALFFTARYVDVKGRTVVIPVVSHLRPQERLKFSVRAKTALTSLTAAPARADPGGYLFQFGARYHFANPFGVAVDASGNVYVADTENYQVEKYDSSGNLLASWGGPGYENGQMDHPEGVAVDGSGNVYVTDAYNNRVQKFDSNGTFLTAWGSYGSGNGQFREPTGVAVDASGNVYVADRGNRRIEKFDGSGGLLAVWDKLGSDNGRDFYPLGVAVAPTGEVYATDPGSATVHKFDSSGNLLIAWPVSGAAYDSPEGVAVDGAGKVYVANSNAVQVFDSSGKFLTAFGSYGTGNGQFQYPWGVAVDGNGDVYVVDTYNQRIEKFDSSGNFLVAWASYGSDNGSFYYPQGAALDRSGNVYVADTYNHRIQKFDSSGSFLTTWGSEGAGNGQFSYPMGVAVDNCGKVYVADTRNLRVQEFDSNGNFLKAWAYSAWSYIGPNGIAVDRDANVYTADLDRQYVEKFDSTGKFLLKTHGCYPFVPPADVGFFTEGVAVDGDGNMYVTDSVTYSVQKLDRTGNCIAVWDRFYEHPSGIAVDGSADVYAVDNGAANVAVLDLNGNFQTTFGSYGTGNGQFISPTGVATDKPGSRVYVADSGNNRIQAFTGYGTTHFAVSAPSSASAGTPLRFTVTALDAAGEVVTGYTDTVRFSSSDGSATLPKDATLANGTGTFPATLTRAGSQTITATDTGAASVTGSSNAIAVTWSSPVADLTITKRHSGSFKRGDRGTYRITVKNSGKAPTTGAVTVTDTLPGGLRVSGINGKGWACTTRPLSCTTSNVVATGASYPPITLTVIVSDNAPSWVTNTATVSGGGELNISNNSASDAVKVKHHHPGKKK
jgi:tripartite motif-containing protein 71